MRQILNELEKFNRIQRIITLVIVVITMSVMGYLLLVLAYSIPTDLMDKTIHESTFQTTHEGARFAISNRENGWLDGSTDAAMLIEAFHKNSQSVWKEAIRCAKYEGLEGTDDQKLAFFYKNGYLDVPEYIGDFSYARYWHGYLVFLKPLLLFLNYGQLRSLMSFFQLGLFTVLVWLLSSRNPKMIFPTFALWVSLNPIATMMSLQYNTLCIITFIALISIAAYSDKWDRNLFAWSILFTIIGGLTSYFDYLTYPIVVLGAALVMWFGVNKCKTLKGDIWQIFRLSFAWCFGYVLLWAMKWIIGSIITEENVFADALNSVAFRTSSKFGDETVSFVDLIRQQTSGFYQISVLLSVLLILIVFIFLLSQKRKIEVNNIVIFLCIALYPFAWYFMAKNHSYIHPYITCRDLAVSVYAIAALVFLNWDRSRN